MDKDLLRIVIIAVGTVVILAMIIWGILSSRSKRKNINFYDDRDPLEHIDPHLIVNINDDDFDEKFIDPRDLEPEDLEDETKLIVTFGDQEFEFPIFEYKQVIFIIQKEVGDESFISVR